MNDRHKHFRGTCWKVSRVLLLSFIVMVTGTSLEAEAQSKAALGSLANAKITDLGLQISEVDLSSKKVTLKFHQVSIEKLLAYLEQEENIQFSYNEKLLTGDPKITINLDNVGLDQALDEILIDRGIDYYALNDGYIVLRKRQGEEALIETVTGQVTEASSGETLPGVNVLVKGTTTGTSTNSEGEYRLGVPSLQDTLVFSFIGYQSQEVPINGRTTVNVTLQTQTVMGEEMVVVGYGTTNRADITTSISSVNPDDINISAKPSINDMLFGQAAGLRVTQESAHQVVISTFQFAVEAIHSL